MMQLTVLEPRRLLGPSPRRSGGSSAADERAGEPGLAEGPEAAFQGGPRCIGAVRVLRLSLTDRCNLRCLYCMPAQGLHWLPRDVLLRPAEIATVAEAAVSVHGIRSFKLTGGEPTVRGDLLEIVRRLRDIRGVQDLSLTTNGLLLEHLALPLRKAGLDRVTVSLDSLQPARFRQITRGGDLQAVLRGLEACEQAGLRGTKLNVVSMRGVNDDEMIDFARLSRDLPVTVRFIEYMPLGDAALMHSASAHRISGSESGPAGGCGAQDRGSGVFMAEAEVRSLIERELGPLEPLSRASEPGVGPSVVYRLRCGRPRGRIGFISAMSQPFCSTCNRLRLTADGVLRSCLFEGGEVDVRSILRRPGDSRRRRVAIAEAMAECVRLKPLLHSGHGSGQMSRIGG